MAGDLLQTGLSGLTAFRNVLNTTSHNIANVNTDGYSRQRVELDTLNPQLTGAGFVGSGVTTTTITRLYDQFLSTQLRSSTSATTELETYFSFATQVDSVLANQNVGLNTALQDFFNAVQAVADDPTSIPARQVLLTEAEVLENRFSSLDQLFDDITRQLNGSLQGNISDINNIAESIASLNDKIVTQTGNAGGQPPNDLLDQRDQLLTKLSELVNVTTTTQENGAVNVFIGNGQSLVLGITSNTIALQPKGFDANAVDIVFQQGSTTTLVTQFMTGGEIGGSLKFRDEVLDPAINTLGQVALVVAHTVNEQHANGIDLDGEQGLNFFAVPSITTIQTVGAGGGVSVSIDDPSLLTTDDYQVDFDGTNYTVTNLTTNSSTSNTTGADITVEGLTFSFTGLTAGDEFRIRPARDGAGGFAVAITDPRDVAAALPVVSEATVTNTGSGAIGSIDINNLATNTLVDNITLTFDSVNNEYDFSYGAGPTTGSIPYDPSTDSGTTGVITVPGFGDISFTMTGQPDDGDSFTLVDNAGGVGDNRNMLFLSDLQTTKFLDGGVSTFQESYGQIVADVGRRTQAAEVNGAAQRGLLAQTVASIDSISGVNLDEEAANLVRFQQAYQASSQVVLTARTIFDTLIGVFR